MSNLFRTTCIALVAVLWLVGSAAAQDELPTSSPPMALPSPAVRATQSYAAPLGDYVIGPGDVVDIKVYKQPDLTGKFRVGENGTIDMLFIGRQQLAGLTEDEAAEVLRQALRKYLRQPEVNVSVVEFNSRAITVIGAVRSPGRLPLRRAMRLLDVIALSGGLVEDSSRFVNIIRYVSPPAGQSPTTGDDVSPDVDIISVNIDEIIAGNTQNNILLQSGDIVSVPRADVVYLAGNVRRPGPLTTRNPITVTQAIAMANGLADGAKRNDIRLYRTVPGKLEREEIKISLASIQSGKQKDLFLQANDVLYVPHSEAGVIRSNLARNLPLVVVGTLVPLLTTGLIR